MTISDFRENFMVGRFKHLLYPLLYRLQIAILSYFIYQKRKPLSIHTRFKTIKQYIAACILDEFSYECFRHELTLIQLDSYHFIPQLNTQPIDFLLVESAWRGKDGQWLIGHRKCFYPLLRLTNYCKKKNIPTLFWVKEDPIHFHNFIDVAKLFDYVFTTDQNMVEHYKKILKHQNIYVLPFAMQPQMHNPIQCDDREKKICFAGTYYQHKYPERKQFLDSIFDIAKQYGLAIYDRNYHSKLKQLQFPENYAPYIIGHLSYSHIQKAYKGYSAAINVNTVTNSPTMMSRRVYELIACYTPLITNYSLSVYKEFSDTVFFFDSKNPDTRIFNDIFNDPEHIQERLQQGYRKVFRKHTYQHRTRFLLEAAKLPYQNKDESILVIGIISHPKQLESIQKQFAEQTYPHKQLLVFEDNATTEQKIKETLSLQPYDYLAYFEPSDNYGAFYLEDFFHAFTYAKTDIVTKERFFMLEGNKKTLVGTAHIFTYGDTDVHFARSMIRKNAVFSALDISNKLIKGRHLNTDIFNYLHNYLRPQQT